MPEPIGSGRRFRRLAGKLAKDPTVRNPEALAATMGRRKYGAKRMAQLAAAGRRRAGEADDGGDDPAAESRARGKRTKV